MIKKNHKLCAAWD